MLKKNIEKCLNDHLNLEFGSAHLYLSMSAFLESINFSGCAHWMLVQYHEEMAHTMKFFKYINDREGRVILDQIPKPDHDWQDLRDVFSATLAHEQGISEAINTLVGIAMEENDWATQSLLQWFVSEQVEEEANASSILGKLDMLGDSRQGLYLLDQELGSRPFPGPAA